MAWTSGPVVEFWFLHTVVVVSISSGGDHVMHCWWHLIRSKQLFSEPYVACRCVPDFLVMVISNWYINSSIYTYIYIYIYIYICIYIYVSVCMRKWEYVHLNIRIDECHLVIRCIFFFLNKAKYIFEKKNYSFPLDINSLLYEICLWPKSS